MKKKLIAMITVAVLLLAIVTGCAAPKQAEQPAADKPNQEVADEPAGSGTVDGKAKRAAFVATGMLGDQSFNDSMWAGLKRAQEEFGIDIKVLESDETSDWEPNLIAMAEEGYDLIVMPTQLVESLQKIAGNYPDVCFGMIDTEVEGANIQSALFAQNEAAFLVGVAAAAFTTHSEIKNVNGDKKIGFIGGMDIPVINDYLAGFEQGAKMVDPEIQVMVSYCGSFNDPLKGKELADAQYSQGVDIIYNLGATSGTGVLESAVENGKYAIGGDVNEDIKYPGTVLISQLKRTDTATYLMAKDVAEGTFKSGPVTLNLANEGVGVTDMSVMKEALGDTFPQELPGMIEEYKQKIIDGEIKVDHAEGFTI